MKTIVSGIDHQTECMAEVVEQELDQVVRSQPSYIQDTTNFLKRLEGMKMNLPQNFLMFTMDIKALYPSVPKKEGLEAC